MRRHTAGASWMGPGSAVGAAKAAELSFADHVLMENRNGSVMEVVLSQANGMSETATTQVLAPPPPRDAMEANIIKFWYICTGP